MRHSIPCSHVLRSIFPPATVALAFLAACPALAQLSLTDSPGRNDFVLCEGGHAAALFVEPDANPSVLRAAGDLADDVARVTGTKPSLTHDPAAASPSLVIIGTLGQSRILDRLAGEGRLETNGIAGQWESYVLERVTHPFPGVSTALVVAGSDRRGTIYGIYQLSELIGVSPWYSWADVPPKQTRLLAIRGDILKQGPPAVKYRGIFLNDEDWGLRPWAGKTFDPATGNIGPKTYAKIFELLLRLRANFLWPAMHEGTPAFNSFPTNKELADLYGIVMGSSHCEQMLRDNVDEWKRDGQGEYNYVVNRDGVLKYWEQRVRENAKFESVYTVGMRGIHDSGMPGGGTELEKAERLHQIIQDQRDLLRRWVNPDVTKVPQIFCPYKEVLGLYRLAPDIPDDITLVWPDDNYGYVRQYSDAREQRRSGGAGVYYHLSYWGRPYDYLWLCTTPPALIREELSKAWDYGARTLWVINVGDLKPAEIGIEFAMDLAWNPQRWNGGNVNDFLTEMFARDFGPKHAKEIAAILAEYYQLNFARKPEHMGIDPRNAFLAKPVFSVMANGDEAARRLAAFRALADRAEAVGRELPPEFQDAYFELVAYPVRAAAAMNEKGLDLARYYTYADQGRACAAGYLEKAREAYDAIQRETDTYNNRIAGGKWRDMMSAHPRKLAVFDMPNIKPPAVPGPARLGVAAEGTERAILAGATNCPALELPQFNKLLPRSYFVDVFDGGSQPLHWTAAASADWIQLSHREGDGDQRVEVSVDWRRAPAGDDARGTIRFSGAGREIPVGVSAFNPPDSRPLNGADFVEDNRLVVMEAAHASAMVPGRETHWTVLRGLGYSGEAVTVSPTTAPVRDEPARLRGESPCLEYRLWIRTPGEWNVTLRTLPTFSVEAGKPQRYAVALDDAEPQIVSLPLAASELDRHWQQDVLRNAALTTSGHRIEQPGLHTLKIWMVDPGIMIDTIIADNGSKVEGGYTGPEETRLTR